MKAGGRGVPLDPADLPKRACTRRRPSDGAVLARMSDMRAVRDHYLPPDHAAFVAAEPPTGRVIVIAPTRAACETIELALALHIDTVLEQEHGDEVRALARGGKG